MRLHAWGIVLLGCLPALAGVRTVGPDGDPRRLRIEGRGIISADQIRNALALDVPTQLAGSPAAPLSEYLFAVQSRLTLGYQHCGFPHAKVQPLIDPAGGPPIVRVSEGPRFLAGDVRVVGAKSVKPEPLVRAFITFPATSPVPTRLDRSKRSIRLPTWEEPDDPRAPLWRIGQPAPFDSSWLDSAEEAAYLALAEQGFFRARFRLDRPTEGAGPAARAALVIDILDEGPAATLGRLNVTGAKKNTPDEIATFLDLPPGAPVDLTRLRSARQKLWNCGRFLRHDLVATPDRDQPGRIDVGLDVIEHAHLPPLSQPLPPAAAAILKCRDWLDRALAGDEDLLVTSDGPDSLPLPITLTFAVNSRAGFAVHVRPRRVGRKKPAPPVELAAALTPGSFSGYSPPDGRRFSAAPGHYQLWAKLYCVPDPRRDGGGVRIDAGGGFTTPGSATPADRPPFRFNHALAPVFFLNLVYPCRDVHGRDPILSLDDGVYTLKQDTFRLRFRADDGRLIELAVDDAESNVHARVAPARGALAREIASLDAACPANVYRAGRPISSLASFAATALARNPLLAPAILLRRPELSASVAALLSPENLAPLDDAFATCPDRGGDFSIPADLAPPPAAASYCSIFLFAIPLIDDAFARPDWPWTIMRQVLLVPGGQTRFTGPEVQRFLASDDVGPLGCLIAARLMTHVNARAAQAAARRGLDRLTPEAFARDCRALFHANSPSSRVLLNLLRAAAALPEDQLSGLSALLPPGLSDALKNTSATDQALDASLDRWWDRSFRAVVERELRRIASLPAQ